MDLAYTQHYRELYERHWWWRARERFILSTIERVRTNGSWGRILDIGCGDGLLFDRLSKFGDVEGVEPDPAMVTIDNPWKDRIYTGSFDETFQPAKRYSLILMLDVLEHFSDPLPCLRRALDLLDSKGVLVITVPAFRCLWTVHDDLNHHFNRYTKSSLTQLTTKAGMTIHSSRYFFHWIFPVKLLMRLKEHLIHTNPNVPDIPPHWLNETMYQLSCIEQQISDTVAIPFGSSLIVVGGRYSISL